MIVGLQTAGVDGALVLAQLEALALYCERLYRAHPSWPRVDESGVRYRPDPPSDRVLLVAPDVWGTHVSCGSAAAAYVGWQRAHGAPRWEVFTFPVAPGVWHAVAYQGDVRGHVVWDPMKDMPR